MKQSEVPPFPQRASATPTTGDPTRFFPHPTRANRWVVSPDALRWVVYLRGPKVPVGWEDLEESEAGRQLRAFDPER
jgi:hypothetical protein